MTTSTDYEHITTSLLWAYHIQDPTTAAPIELDGLKNAAGGYTWVHFQAGVADISENLKAIGLHENVVEGLCMNDSRPKAMQFADGTLTYLRGINRNPDADPEDMVSLRIWLTKDRIVTVRRKGRRLLSVQDVRDELERGNCPASPADLMIELVATIADRISEYVDLIDEQLSTFEGLAQSEQPDRIKLSQLRRQSAAIRRYLAPQREALDAIYRVDKSLTQQQIFDLRDQSDRMTRYVEDLDLAKERSMVLQDELRNRIAEQQGMRMYVLSLVTAIFLPLSFLTGVFGMNVAGLPGLENPSAFTVLTSSMGGLAVVLLIVMAWKRWF